MAIRIHAHARQRLSDRGASVAEALATVQNGSKRSAKYGRSEFILRFNYNRMWMGKRYSAKSVHAFAAPQGKCDWLIVTVIVKFLK
jgi:hypothetical protein